MILASNFITPRYLNTGFHDVNGAAQSQIQAVTYFCGRFPATFLLTGWLYLGLAQIQDHLRRQKRTSTDSADPTLLAHWSVQEPFGLLCPQGPLYPGITAEKMMGTKKKVNCLLLNSYSVRHCTTKCINCSHWSSNFCQILSSSFHAQEKWRLHAKWQRVIGLRLKSRSETRTVVSPGGPLSGSLITS